MYLDGFFSPGILLAVSYDITLNWCYIGGPWHSGLVSIQSLLDCCIEAEHSARLSQSLMEQQRACSPAIWFQWGHGPCSHDRGVPKGGTIPATKHLSPILWMGYTLRFWDNPFKVGSMQSYKVRYWPRADVQPLWCQHRVYSNNTVKDEMMLELATVFIQGHWTTEGPCPKTLCGAKILFTDHLLYWSLDIPYICASLSALSQFTSNCEPWEFSLGSCGLHCL